MRLLVRKVYRAFPELDSYSDEQCSRFVSAAKRGFGRKLLRYGLLGTALLMVMLAVLAWSAKTAMAVPLPNKSPFWWREFIGVVALVAMGLPSLALVWYFRDWMLRRRIESVLRTRGRCAGCGYSLIGLPVSATTTVICPECGFEGSVDESLGELTIDAQGKQRSTPNPEAAPNEMRVHTRRRMRRRRRFRRAIYRVGYALAGVVALLAVVVGVYEWRLRVQAQIAQAATPTLSDLRSVYSTYRPADARSGPTAFDLLSIAMTKAAGIQAGMEAGPLPLTAWGSPISVNAGAIAVTPMAELRAPANPQSELAWSVKLLDAYAAAGIEADIDAAIGAPHECLLGPSDRLVPLARIPFSFGAVIRAARRLNEARLRMAVVRNEPQAFAQALESLRAVVSISEDVPLWYGLAESRSTRVAAARTAIQALGSNPSESWVQAVSSTWWVESELPLQIAAIEVYRLFTLDMLARRFGDPAICRLYFATPGPNSMFESTMSQRWSFGSFESNRQALDELVSGAKRAAAMDAINRPALPAGPYPPLIEEMRPLLVLEMTDSDYVRALFRGLVTLLAIERYRLNNGAYPSALSDLVPSQLASIPLDPWTGKPLCFKLIDPLTDVQHRSFLLYSVGKDGVDNGGLESPTLTRMGLYDARGFDLIINTNSE